MAPKPLDHFKRGYQDLAVELEQEQQNHYRSSSPHLPSEDRIPYFVFLTGVLQQREVAG
jgi:hypothetical protein